ncbi:MAG: hypothetical protein Q4D62_03980 [Planctomycetia bacterium]|nr:hypothetical protein [Planctomycetia bacterium]
MQIPKIPLSNRFLFHFALPCRHLSSLAKRESLPENCRLMDLDFLEQESQDVCTMQDIRGAWCSTGLALEFWVTGKKQLPWCHPNRPEESDRVEIWLDTRNVRNVHRANQFCHRFLCLPTGAGKNGEMGAIFTLPINRARQQPSEIPHGVLRIASKVFAGGYSIYIFLSKKGLTGYDPKEFHDLGIAWEISDHELGTRTLTAGNPFPYQEDPSLWYTLSLREK